MPECAAHIKPGPDAFPSTELFDVVHNLSHHVEFIESLHSFNSFNSFNYCIHAMHDYETDEQRNARSNEYYRIVLGEHDAREHFNSQFPCAVSLANIKSSLRGDDPMISNDIAGLAAHFAQGERYIYVLKDDSFQGFVSNRKNKPEPSFVKPKKTNSPKGLTILEGSTGYVKAQGVTLKRRLDESTDASASKRLNPVDENKFTCKCGKVCGNQSALTRHMKQCDVCQEPDEEDLGPGGDDAEKDDDAEMEEEGDEEGGEGGEEGEDHGKASLIKHGPNSMDAWKQMCARSHVTTPRNNTTAGQVNRFLKYLSFMNGEFFGQAVTQFLVAIDIYLARVDLTETDRGRIVHMIHKLPSTVSDLPSIVEWKAQNAALFVSLSRTTKLKQPSKGVTPLVAAASALDASLHDPLHFVPPHQLEKAVPCFVPHLFCSSVLFVRSLERCKLSCRRGERVGCLVA